MLNSYIPLLLPCAASIMRRQPCREDVDDRLGYLFLYLCGGSGVVSRADALILSTVDHTQSWVVPSS